MMIDEEMKAEINNIDDEVFPLTYEVI